MATTIRLLNLDDSYPVEDTWHTSSYAKAGVIRFIDASDANTLPAIQRLQGDIVNRFKLHENKVNEVITVLSENPTFNNFDDSVFVRADGSVGFNGVIKGVRPVSNDDLSTKAYVDDWATSVNRSITELAGAIGSINETSTITSSWEEYVWQSGEKTLVELPLLEPISNIDDIVSITLLEKINVSISTSGNPDPDPRWIIRQLSGPRSVTGVDDIWYEEGKVFAAIPNAAFYQSGYDSSYSSIWPVSERFLRASVSVLKA